MANPRMMRQGDILFTRVEAAPKETTVAQHSDRIVVALGEVTGHAHAVVGTDVELLTVPTIPLSEEVDRWLRVGSGGATVVHEEHGAIALEPGDWRVRRQREWSDADEPVPVRD